MRLYDAMPSDDKIALWLQEAFLKAYGITPALQAGAPLVYQKVPEGDPLYDAMVDLRKGIRLFMGKQGAFTQAWMRSALFLGTVGILKGAAGFDAAKEAVWAYTAALTEGIGRLCSNPDILNNAPDGRKFDAGMALITELRHAVDDQMRLLRDIGKAKVEYEKTEASLEYGRMLLKAVHALDENSTGADFRGLCLEIGKHGPGALPKTDWDAAVMIAKAILYYENKKANNAPESAHKCPKENA